MKRLFNKLHALNKLPNPKKQLSGHEEFIRGAFWGLLVFSLFMMAFAGYYFRTGLSPYLQIAAYIVIGLVAFYVFRWLGTLARFIFQAIPPRYVSLILATIATYMLARYMRLSWPQSHVNATLGFGISGFILLGGAIRCLWKSQGSKAIYLLLSIISLVCLYLPFSKIISAGKDPHPIDFKAISAVDLTTSGIGNPGNPGQYDFDYFTYGSGTDSRRPAYGNSVKYKTQPVDGSPMLPEWTGRRKKWRERYWGFGIDEAPINGRVWMPKKEGKLPLILIVHGNHGMEHYSDPGYAYLGELLASRGFITVSVDENFINGTWSGDFRGREMPIRAWLLLKHLEQWRAWSQDISSDLYEKADTDNVILIGHSRGGEAVSIAAAYNKLSHFPDNANITFDFNFGIKGLVTIAPTDQRYFRRLELSDISYLSLQGSYDADEASFFGLRQYQRITLSDSTDFFKAGILIHRANHGQFNSIWGRRDFGEPFGWFLNTEPLISGEDQRQAAKVFIGAFTERVFNDASRYDHLFKNSASAQNWLPKTVFLNNFQLAGDQILVDYEEDIDPITVNYGAIRVENLSVWREEALKMRGGETQGTNAVILGWDSDSVKSKKSYQIALNKPLTIQPSDKFIFSIGRASDKDLKVNDTLEVDFSIDLITETNDTLSTNLSDFKKIVPKLKVRYMKLDKMNASFGGVWELAMETVEIPMEAFHDSNLNIKGISFSFDKTKQGLIALDNIGFRRSAKD